jgi:hypothetical protein
MLLGQLNMIYLEGELAVGVNPPSSLVVHPLANEENVANRAMLPVYALFLTRLVHSAWGVCQEPRVL